MKLSADRDRLLVAIGCALVIHAGVAVGLSLVEWSVTPERTPLYVELSDPVLVDVPETPEPVEPPPDTEPPVPAEPEPPEPEPAEPEPEETLEPPPAESEPEPVDEPDPVEEPEPAEEPEPTPDAPAPEEPAPAPDEEQLAEPEPDEPAPAPEPEPRRPQGPTEEEVAEALGGMLGTQTERERAARDPVDPEPSVDDGEVARLREEARREFERALEQEEEYFDSLEDAGEPADEVGERDAAVTPRIHDLIGRATVVPDRPSEPVSDAPVTASEERTEVPGGGIVEWEGGGDRRLIEYWLPDFDGSDLRESGAPEVRARVSFEVDAQGSVRPGSVNVLAPGLDPRGRRKVIEAVSSWRFEARPGVRVARGSIDFIFERTG